MVSSTEYDLFFLFDFSLIYCYIFYGDSMKDAYLKDIEKVLDELEVDPDKGLSFSEAKKRAGKYGYNTLPKKKNASVLKIFFSGMLDPIVILLMITVLFSFVIGEYVDGFIVLIIIVLDLILGTFEEYEANKNADSLQKLIKNEVKVLRNEQNIAIDSELLVPGDIVFLESGDNITCDMRVIECTNLQVNESVLTGESTSVFKTNKKISSNVELADRNNMLYAGSNIVTGRCMAVVIATGINTEVGYIADTVSKIKEEKSPLTIRINKLSSQITLLISIIAVIIVIILFNKGFSFNEVFMSTIALSVSAMPEGLPLALTMALTITSSNMVKKKVIVKKLNYVESLGSCTVIATDKTGTLTVNEQTAKVILLPNDERYEVSGVGYNTNGKIEKLDLDKKTQVDKLVLAGSLNNESRKVNNNKYVGDSIDIAFCILSEKENVYHDDYEIIGRIPYESENKYSAVFYKYQNEYYCTVKGSFEIVESMCNKMQIDDDVKKIDSSFLLNQNERLSQDGYRVIALATGKINSFILKDNYNIKDIPKLIFMGMVGFIDPVRSDVKESIIKCHEAGIKVIMITGDHPLTAFAIAKELELADEYNEVITGSDLSKYTDEELDDFVLNKKVYARVTPHDKLRIVESLKRKGEFVAVTGDGVNDAMALRSANIGISMGSGTDAAKETSNMIILDDSFRSICDGIELGRVAYSNIRKVCFFLLSCGVAEVLFFLLSIVFNLPMPLVAIQLLWLNLVTDGLQDLALSFEKKEKGIMKRKPISTKENIFNKELFNEVAFSGLFIGLVIFIVWYLLINKFELEVTLARSYTMALMVFLQNIHVFNCRSEKTSAFLIPITSNPLLIITVFGSILLQIIVMEVPFLSKFLKVSSIPFYHLLLLMVVSLIILIVMEIYKLVKNMRKQKNDSN